MDMTALVSDASLEVAVIGCGRMGTNFSRTGREMLPPGWAPASHAEAVRKIPGLKLTAVCDPDPLRLADAVERFPGVIGYADPEALFREQRPDIVTIATRTPQRRELILLAAQHGVRALHIEKPLARSLAECGEILNEIETRGIKLSYGTTRRYMSAYREAGNLVRGGAIGELRHIAIEHGRDLLLWGHPHSVDLLLFFSGCSEVDYVQGNLRIDPIDVAESIVDADPVLESATVRFGNGIIGTITQSGGLNVRLTGTEGTLAVLADGTEIELRRRGQGNAYFLEKVVPEITSPNSGTETAFLELLAALRSGGTLSISPDIIRLNQKILLSIAYSSILGGTRIALDEIGAEFAVTGRYGSLYA